MFVRRSVLLAVAGVLATAACRDVEQRDPAPILVLATFDPGQPGVRAATIPLPNDLALRGAPFQTGATQAGLLGLIDLGGWPDDYSNAAWSQIQGIAIPIRAQAFNPATGAYVPAAPPTDIDADTLTERTVAIVRMSDATPTVLRAARVAFSRPSDEVGAVAFLVLRPAGDDGIPLAEFPAGRYVVALRGGSNGVHALVGEDRIPLEADLPIALIAPNRDLSQPENQPPGGLDEAQITSLETLRASFALPLDWTRVADETTCRTNTPIPEAVAYPGRCWLPAPSTAITPAFAAVAQVFPHEEIASIQTFEIVDVGAALQEEVTP